MDELLKLPHIDGERFRRYSSIDNISANLVEKVKREFPDDLDDWCVTLKIHGANIAFYLTGDKQIRAASRNQFIGHNFFNYQRVVDKYSGNIVKTAEIAADYHSVDIEDIIIFGEIFGGHYDGEPYLGVKRVQKEVQYTNDIEFMAFDIMVKGEYAKTFVSSDIFQTADLPYTPFLFYGALDECIKWSEKHYADPDPLWKHFGMSKEIEGNVREGHVIRPRSRNLVNNGGSRIIFKDKNTLFKEKKGCQKPKHVIPEGLLSMVSESEQYITKNRFNAVVSKIGEYNIKMFADIMNDMALDILSEMKKDYPDADTHVWVELLPHVIKKVSRWMGRNKKELF